MQLKLLDCCNTRKYVWQCCLTMTFELVQAWQERFWRRCWVILFANNKKHLCAY